MIGYVSTDFKIADRVLCCRRRKVYATVFVKIGQYWLTFLCHCCDELLVLMIAMIMRDNQKIEIRFELFGQSMIEVYAEATRRCFDDKPHIIQQPNCGTRILHFSVIYFIEHFVECLVICIEYRRSILLLFCFSLVHGHIGFE